jgi:hypothetical protein
MFNWFKRSSRGPRPPAAFPYPLTTVHGREALAAFERIKREGKGLPILLGSDDDLRRLVERFEYADEDKNPPSLTLQRATTLTFPEGFRAERDAELRALIGEDGMADLEEGFEIGDWPQGHFLHPRPDPAITMNITENKHVEKVHIATVPTADATEIPAYLHWGGWNACPKPHQHVAAARHWRTTYGAELVTMAADTVEFRVQRRPKTRDEALALAREHHDYNGEIQNLSDHAADLMASDWWFFWWD